MIVKTILRIIFWLTIAFILVSVFSLTIGQWIPIEFSDNRVQSNYYYFVFSALPISFLLTLTGTIKRKNSKFRNWTSGILTVLAAGLRFFILVQIMFSVGFGAWTTEEILFREKTDKNITIKRQIFDLGALGYGGRRTARLTPLLHYFQIVKQVDPASIDKSQWILVNEEGDLK